MTFILSGAITIAAKHFVVTLTMKTLPVRLLMDNSGVSTLGVILFIIIFLFAIFGFDIAYIAYSKHCQDEPISKCFSKENPSEDSSKETVVAKGSISFNKYGVTVSINIPLSGGQINGKFNGSCDGVISGTYDGKDNGVISGSAHGSCSPFLVPVPASANFSGTVNKQSKTVPLSGTGSGAGFSKSGSLILTY